MNNAPRRLVVFAGPQDWGTQSAQALISISEISEDSVVYLSTRPAPSKLLGQDKSVLVIDAFDGLNPDVVGQASGTIIAGGALVIICPSLSEWPNYSDPENAKIVPFSSPDDDSPSLYLSRWAHYLASTDGIELDTPDTHLAIAPLIPEVRSLSSSTQTSPDQQNAVKAIIKVVNSKRRRPL
ncbi:MAG: DUF1726 domain-containing protein, partial [Methylococcales bacterium]|nr:DUF1726 domain-containing protein [Methylococcales bacterium]